MEKLRACHSDYDMCCISSQRDDGNVTKQDSKRAGLNASRLICRIAIEDIFCIGMLSGIVSEFKSAMHCIRHPKSSG